MSDRTPEQNAGALLANTGRLANPNVAPIGWTITAKLHDGVPAFEPGDRLVLESAGSDAEGTWSETVALIVAYIDIDGPKALYTLELAK